MSLLRIQEGPEGVPYRLQGGKATDIQMTILICQGDSLDF